MNIIYFYTMLLAVFTAMALKIVIDFRNVSRLSKINKNNKKLCSICVAILYQDSMDDLINQIRSLNLRKNKLTTIAVLIRANVDEKTRNKILSSIHKITKNKIILIDFKNIRGITTAIKNNCTSDLVILIDKMQNLSKDFMNRIIKISSRYTNQQVFAPNQHNKIGNSLGSLISVRSSLISDVSQHLFGAKINLKKIEPGIVYRTDALQKNITSRVAVESVCSVENDHQNLNILAAINNQISHLSSNKISKVLFGAICALTIAVLFVDNLYMPNLFLIYLYFIFTFYIFIGIISQFGGRKYSLYENICLLAIMPIYVVIVGVEYLLAILELFQKRISKNNKRN